MEMQDSALKSQEKLQKDNNKQQAEMKKTEMRIQKPAPKQDSGRPPGIDTPQPQDRQPGQIGDKQSRAYFSIEKVRDHLLLADKLNNKVEDVLKKKHKLKELNAQQKEVVQGITELVIANEKPVDWNKVTKIRKYINKPQDTNKEAVAEIREISYEHQVDSYLAGILYASKTEAKPCQE